MSKGGYRGGSTTIGPGSDWFSYRKPKPNRWRKKLYAPAGFNPEPETVLIKVPVNPTGEVVASETRSQRIMRTKKMLHQMREQERVADKNDGCEKGAKAHDVELPRPDFAPNVRQKYSPESIAERLKKLGRVTPAKRERSPPK